MSSACPFGSGRDIAYVVVSIVQTIITVVQTIITVAGLWWVNRYIRKKDKKDEEQRKAKKEREKKERLEKEEREKKERLEKEEREKITDIINNEYDKIVQEGIDEKLRKCKKKFEAMVMFYGSTVSENGDGQYEIVTGLDVLKFMLLNPNNFKGEPLKILQEDLEAVQKLFRALRLKLPLKGDCPINIKEELGPLITGVGEIARSFVSAKKRYTISIVLKYFGNVQENVRSIDDEEKEDKEHSRKIRRILPYVNGVSLGNIPLDCHANGENSVWYHEKDFWFETTFVPQNNHVQVISDLRSIEPLRKENIRADRLRKLVVKIKENWPGDIPVPDWSKEEHLNANIIHAGRVFLFDVGEGKDIIQKEDFRKLVEEMKITLAQCSVEQEEISFKAIGNIQKSIQNLGLSRQCLHPICGQKSIASMLDEVSKFIEKSIRQAEGSN